MQNKKIIGLEGNVFFAGLVSFFMDFSSEMIYPLVPIFLSSVLGVNKSVIGLIEGTAESTASLLKVFSGWLSDRMGRRKILMLAGYGISSLSRPLIALSTLWGHVLVFRFIDRCGKGIRGAPRDAIIAESSPRKELGRSFGFHRGMDTLGAVAGPAVAFIILSLFTGNYRIVFWLSMIPGIIAVLFVLFFIREQKNRNPEAKKREPFAVRNFWPGLDWRYKAFVAVAALFALGNSSDVFLILRAQQIGIPTLMIPIIYLFFNLVYSLSSIPAGLVADKFGRKRVILLGFVLFAAIYYGFAIAGSTTTIWLLFGFYGVFMGLTEGVQKAFLATIIPQDFKATAFGVYNTAVGLAMLPASLIGGYLWDKLGPHATFYYGILTAAISSLLFFAIFGFDKLKSRI